MEETHKKVVKTYLVPAEFEHDAVVSIDHFAEGLLLQLEKKQLQILLMDGAGNMRTVSQTFAKGTPTARVSREHLLAYDRSNARFSLINNQQTVTMDGQYSVSEDSTLTLFYFRLTSQVCLLQQWPQCSSIKITFFTINLPQNSIVVGKSYESQYRPQDLSLDTFKLNEYGTICWATAFYSKLQLHTYNEKQGYRQYSIGFESLCPIFNEQQFYLLQAWTTNNLLYLAVSPTNQNFTSSYSQFSPIIFIRMDDPQTKPTFIEFAQGWKEQLTKAYSIENYCVLVCKKNEDESTIFAYSKQSQTVTQKDDKFKGRIFKSYCNNTLITYNSSENAILSSRYMKQPSYPTRRLLQVLQHSQLLQKTIKKAILIFGSEKSGKTTLRYFLSGEKLILKTNQQLGYKELICQSLMSKGQQDWQHRSCALSAARQEVAIVEIPDWLEGGSSVRVELQLLLTRLFRIFQQFHFVVTIPMQEIDDSYKNATFFSELFSLIANGVQESKLSTQSDGVQNFMSIILTRVDNGSQSAQVFQQRIEQIKEINSDTGNKLEQISSYERILYFENRETTQQQGLQLLQNLLQFDRQHLQQKKDLFVEKNMENGVEQLMGITKESIDIYLLTNAYLVWIAHTFSPHILEYSTDYLQSYQPLLVLDSIDIEKNKETVASLYLNILNDLKKITNNNMRPESNEVDRLRDNFISITQEIFGETKEKALILQQILPFCALLRLTINEDQPRFPAFSVVFGNNIDSVFSTIILPQIIVSLSLLPGIAELQSFRTLQKLLPKNRGKTKRVLKIQMTYQQEKASILRSQSNLLDKICQLPSNALKLDLLLHQLSEIVSKPAMSDKDYRYASFFIRQSSRICQYHSQYQQSLILLSIIPDFNSIERLLDEYVHHLKKSAPYDSKKYFSSKQQTEIIQKLLTLAQINVRQNLVRKLINIINLSLQLVNKTKRVKEEVAKNYRSLPTKESIKRYKQRLEQQRPDLQFYDFKDPLFIKMMEKRQDLIERCLQFENSKESCKTYEKMETFRYLLDCMPTVTV